MTFEPHAQTGFRRHTVSRRKPAPREARLFCYILLAHDLTIHGKQYVPRNYENDVSKKCCKNSNSTAQLAQSSRPAKTEHDFLVRIMDLEKKKKKSLTLLFSIQTAVIIM